MPKSRIMIQLEDETIERIDQARGAIPRAAWFRIAADNLLDQASVSQQEENRSPKPGDERSNRSRRAVGEVLIKCVCGGVILQDGPNAGKCTKCAKLKEAK